MNATPAGIKRADVHGYISDMLAQLAEMAAEAGSENLERSLRLLALEAALGGEATASRSPRRRRKRAAAPE